jgi:hypothetical protein
VDRSKFGSLIYVFVMLPEVEPTLGTDRLLLEPWLYALVVKYMIAGQVAYHFL